MIEYLNVPLPRATGCFTHQKDTQSGLPRFVARLRCGDVAKDLFFFLWCHRDIWKNVGTYNFIPVETMRGRLYGFFLPQTGFERKRGCYSIKRLRLALDELEAIGALLPEENPPEPRWFLNPKLGYDECTNVEDPTWNSQYTHICVYSFFNEKTLRRKKLGMQKEKKNGEPPPEKN